MSQLPRCLFSCSCDLVRMFHRHWPSLTRVVTKCVHVCGECFVTVSSEEKQGVDQVG